MTTSSAARNVVMSWFLDRSAAQITPFEYSAIVLPTAQDLSRISRRVSDYDVRLHTRRYRTYLYHAVTAFRPDGPLGGVRCSDPGVRLDARIRALSAVWGRLIPRLDQLVASWRAIQPAEMDMIRLSKAIDAALRTLRWLYSIHMGLVWPGMIAMAEFQAHYDAAVRAELNVGALDLVGTVRIPDTLLAAEALREMGCQPTGSVALARGDRDYRPRYQGEVGFGLAEAEAAEIVPAVAQDLARLGHDGPLQQRERAARSRAERVRRMITCLGVKAPAFNDALARAQAGATLSETHGLYLHEAPMRHLRQLVGEAGRRLADRGIVRRPEDVLLLRAGELSPSLQRDGPAVSAVTARHAELARWADWAPPWRLGASSPALPSDDPFVRLMHALFVTEPPGVATADTVCGSPASSGAAAGRVRVVAELADCVGIRPDEVLVTRTGEAWVGVVLPLAAGLVAEGASPITHIALLARELGRPAVVGAGGALHLLASGDHVEVDGNRGIVRRLSASTGA